MICESTLEAGLRTASDFWRICDGFMPSSADVSGSSRVYRRTLHETGFAVKASGPECLPPSARAGEDVACRHVHAADAADAAHIADGRGVGCGLWACVIGLAGVELEVVRVRVWLCEYAGHGVCMHGWWNEDKG